MFKPLSLFIGSRFSRGKKRNRLVSFISVSSMLGIAVGVAVIIIGLSAMNGFQKELQDRVLSVIPQGELQAVNPPLKDWLPLLKHVKAFPDIVGAEPYVNFTALLQYNNALKAVAVQGVVPKQEAGISALPHFVKGEAWKNFKAGEKQIIIGQGVAQKLGVKIGNWITAMVPNPDPSLQLKAPRQIRLKVSGILALGGQIDYNFAMVPMADAQAYLGMGNGISGIALKVKDVLKAQQTVNAVGNTLPIYVYLRSWTQQYGYLYHDIQLVRTIMYLVMVLVISVACFNIVSTLMMAVKDRSADIAILRTMGASDRLIKGIFVWHGLWSGVIGSAIGAIVGCLTAINLTEIVDVLEKIVGHQFMSGSVYFVDFLPSQLSWQDVFIVTATAMVLSLCATWYPARRAAALQPAQVLSGK
jgi:lipoprotein-releasing system permease protein